MEMDQMIKDVGLPHKRKDLAKNLSGVFSHVHTEVFLLFLFEYLDGIMQKCKCIFVSVHAPPLGRNIISRLSFLFRLKSPCRAVSQPANMHAAVSEYTRTVPACHRL